MKSNETEFGTDDYVRGDIYLMLKDKPLLRYNIAGVKKRFKVYDYEKLPLALINGIEDDEEAYQAAAFKEWLKDRSIPLSRENAKWLLNALALPQARNDSMITMIKCRALSLTDCYWLKLKLEDTWAEFNLYENSYAEVLDEIALNRRAKSRFTLKGELLTPELSTDGTYAKCWQRESDGIYLYKTGAGRKEVEAEVMASKIAEILGIPHVEYTLAELYGRRCCKCKCMSNNNVSIIPYQHVATAYVKQQQLYGNMTLLDIEKVVKFGNGDLNDFYSMLVFDGLVCNIDRHSHNWGFWVNPDTAEIDKLHPLFDHNCAIDISEDVNISSSLYGEKSILELSKYGLRYVRSRINLPALKDYYKSSEAKEDFKQLYGRLDELDMLKKLYDMVIN